MPLIYEQCANGLTLFHLPLDYY